MPSDPGAIKRLRSKMGFWSTPKRDPGSEVPSGRGGHGSVALGPNKLLIFGGADRTPLGFSDLWLLELVDGHEHWTKITPKLGQGQKKPVPRSGCSLTLINGSVYIFGGQEPVSGAILDELLVLDVGSWDLHTLSRAAQGGASRPPARHSHASGVFECDLLVVFGGAGLRGPTNDVWTFSTSTHMWTCLSQGLQPGDCPAPREMAAGCVISDAGLFVHGGRGDEGQILSDVAIFDGRAGKWVLMQNTPYARCAHTATNAVPQQQPAPEQQQHHTPSPAQQQQQEQVQQEQQQQQQQQTPSSGGAGSPQPSAAGESGKASEQEGMQQEQQPTPSAGGGSPLAEGSPAGVEAAGSPGEAMDSTGGEGGPSPGEAASPEGIAEDASPVSAGGTAGGAHPAAARGGGSTPASPAAANVLLCGGFTGEAVSGELLQLTFVRQTHAAGGASLRVELRPVKNSPPDSGVPGELLAAPPPRFAHSAAVLQRGSELDVVVFGGVNQTDDLNDVVCWSV